MADNDIDAFLVEKSLNLTATLDKRAAYQGASFVIVVTPTNYDPETNRFDKLSVSSVVCDALCFNDKALVVIKSTLLATLNRCRKNMVSSCVREGRFMTTLIRREYLRAVSAMQEPPSRNCW
jgi:UDPglucose 6-dehydrogenase